MMKRKYTIFYSWQSDTPKDERQLIDSALSHAVDEIWNTEQIRVIVDHSTMGEIGMPDITQSLLTIVR